MKITELMIGNWVIAPDEDTKELREVKVARIKEKDIIMDKYFNTIFLETIAPIPITEDFLKKNGFEQCWIIKPDRNYNGCSDWRKVVDKNMIILTIGHSNNNDCYWNIYVDKFNRIHIGDMDIKYVHQLQNVLNILGIEMEVTP